MIRCYHAGAAGNIQYVHVVDLMCVCARVCARVRVRETERERESATLWSVIGVQKQRLMTTTWLMMTKKVMKTSMKQTGQLMFSWRAHVSQGQAKQGGMCHLAQPLQAL